MGDHGDTVGVLVYGGYHELEFWYPVLRLREADIPVSVLGVEGDQAAYSLLGYPVVPNASLTKVSPSDFSAIVIPGGNVDNISENAALKSFLPRRERSWRVRGSRRPASHGTVGQTERTPDELPQWTGRC